MCASGYSVPSRQEALRRERWLGERDGTPGFISKMVSGGDDVKELQGELKELGYDIPEDEANRAFYGQSTSDSVRKFQSDANLTITGIVNQATAEALTEKLEARKA